MKDKILKFGIGLYYILLLILVLKNDLLKQIFKEKVVYVYIIYLFLSIVNIYGIIKTKKSYLITFFLGYLYLNLLCIKTENNFDKIYFLFNIFLIWKNILNCVEEELKVRNVFLNIFMSVFGVFYLLKEKNIIRDDINKNINLKIIFLFFLINLIIFNKKECLKKIKSLLNWQKGILSISEFFQKLIPFYLLKDGGLKIFPILLIGSCIQVLKNKKIKDKKIMIAIIINIFIVFISYLQCDFYGVDSKKNLLNSIEIAIYLFVILNLNWRKKIIQESIYIFCISSLLTIFSVLLLFTENGFKFTRYSDGFLIIPFGIKYSLVSLVLLFIIIKYSKINLIPILLLSVFGIILSGSRSPLGIFIILSCFMSILICRKKNIKKLSYIGIIIIIFIIGIIAKYDTRLIDRSILAIKGKDPSTLTRIEIYKESLRQFKNHPLIGNGISSYDGISKQENKEEKILDLNKKAALFHHTYSHNNLLGILSGTGLIGLVGYIFYQCMILKRVIKTKEFILGIIVYLCFELNGITDMTLIFFSIQKILFFILIIVMQNKEIVKE